jgi:3,4-dihydroxy 2-butanone 4-phosphate synthase/GTP cyclohydrolase II
MEYRIRTESLVQVEASTRLPVKKHGDFTMTVFSNDLDESEHFAVMKLPLEQKIPLVRIHSECVTGDVLGSCKCDCGAQLEASLALIAAEGGVLIYLRQEGRGIGLANKLKAYELQEQGLDTVEANIKLGLPVDSRTYGVAYQILKHLNINAVRLLTNNPQKVEALTQYGIDVKERISLLSQVNAENEDYLKAKKEKLGHLLPT